MNGHAILMYHGVSHERGRRFRRFVVEPSSFEEQMTHLAGAGVRVCSVSELMARRAGELDDGRRAVALTFDDAFRELQTHVAPVLDRLGFGATIYVPTAYVGGTSRWLEGVGEGDRPVLGASELRALADAGVECGAHTHTHPQLDVLSSEAAREEIAVSKRTLEETIEREVLTFAYPFGYESAGVRAAVREAGFASACRVNYAISPPGEDRYALSRLPVYGDCTLQSFAALVEGRSPLRSERALALAWRPIRRGRARLRLAGRR